MASCPNNYFFQKGCVQPKTQFCAVRTEAFFFFFFVVVVVVVVVLRFYGQRNEFMSSAVSFLLVLLEGDKFGHWSKLQSTDNVIHIHVILSLPLIQEGQLSVSGDRMCTILVNRLED